MLSLVVAILVLAADPESDAAAAPSPVIRAIAERGMAPFAVHVHCVDSQVGAGTLLTARPSWNFGDGQGAHNELCGFNAAHLYERPGTYRVGLTLVDEAGRAASASLDVVVSEPARRRLHVSRRGNDDSDGATPATALRSLARAAELLAADTEILFERGFDYPVPPGLRIARRNVVVGAYGEGTRPRLRWTGAADTTAAMIHQIAATSDLVIRDLEFDCPGPPSRTNVRAIHADGHAVTVQRCHFRNVSYAVRAAGSPEGILTLDNTAEVLGGYFVWGEGSDHVHLGNRVAGSADEHNMRFLAERLLIAGNDLTNVRKRTIWCLNGGHVWIEGNRLAEGPVMIGPRPEDEGAWAWAVIERNRIENDAVIVRHGSSHVRISSNLIRLNGRAAIDVWGRSEERRRTCEDVRVLHNTAVNLDRHGRFIQLGPGTQGTMVANNLYAAPHLESGSGGTCNVYVLDENLGSATFAGNLWAEPAITGWGGGWQYVWSYWSNPQGFLSAEAWAQLPQTRDEHFRRFRASDLDNAGSPAFDPPRVPAIPGAPLDLYGAPRPVDGLVIPGAVEDEPDPN